MAGKSADTFNGELMNRRSFLRQAVNEITPAHFRPYNARQGDCINVRVPPRFVRTDFGRSQVTTAILCMVESLEPFRVRPVEITRSWSVYLSDGEHYYTHARKLK